jgi:BirA family biotin operon repressor/biotin-[acetyl-CoA-carboxylase] ligase
MSSAQCQPLSADRLGAALAKSQASIELVLLSRAESSNTVLLAAPPVPSGKMQVCVVEEQTAGRGRQGRVWQAWPGKSLTFSVRIDQADPLPSGLTLAVGVVLAEALEACGSREVQLKWPNDLWVEGRKAGGVLVEVTRAGDRQAVVVGVGLNLLLPGPDEHAPDLHDKAALFASPPSPPSSREAVLARLLIALFELLTRFPEVGFRAYAPAWHVRHALANRPVQVIGDHATLIGDCLGVDDSGALLLKTAKGPVRIVSGDLSLRPAS